MLYLRLDLNENAVPVNIFRDLLFRTLIISVFVG